MLTWLYKLWLAADRASSKIVELVESDPAGWKFTGCQAVHKSGVCIWYANEVYGIKIYEGEGNYDINYWKPSHPERVLIYNAIQGHLRRVRERKQKALYRSVDAALDAAQEEAR